jgi:hypothetical protein
MESVAAVAAAGEWRFESSIAREFLRACEPAPLVLAHIGWRSPESAHDLFRERFGVGLAAKLVQQMSLPHARFGAGEILADILVIEERFVVAPGLFESDRIKQMAVGGVKVRPVLHQFIERGDRRRGLAEAQLRARLADKILRLLRVPSLQDRHIMQ